MRRIEMHKWKARSEAIGRERAQVNSSSPYEAVIHRLVYRTAQKGFLSDRAARECVPVTKEVRDDQESGPFFRSTESALFSLFFPLSDWLVHPDVACLYLRLCTNNLIPCYFH